jgi:hypothetical protein
MGCPVLVSSLSSGLVESYSSNGFGRSDVYSVGNEAFLGVVTAIDTYSGCFSTQVKISEGDQCYNIDSDNIKSILNFFPVDVEPLVM